MKKLILFLCILQLASASLWQDSWRDSENRTFDNRINITLKNELSQSRTITSQFKVNFTAATAPYCDDVDGDSALHTVGLDMLSLRITREFENGTIMDAPFHLSNSTSFLDCTNNRLNEARVIFLADLPEAEKNEGFGNGTSQYWLYYSQNPYPLYSNATLKTGLSKSEGGYWEYAESFFVNTTAATGEYQLRFVMDTEKEIAQGRMEFECSDFRAVIEGKEADYWVENCNTKSTTFWIRVPKAGTSQLFTATYNFYNEMDGINRTEIAFVTDYSIPSEGEITIAEEEDGHDKVLKIEGGDSHVHAYHESFNQESGAIEFWWKSSDEENSFFSLVQEDIGTGIQLRMRDNGQFSWYDGANNDVGPYTQNQWHHHRIIFDSGAGTNGQFSWYVDGSLVASNIEFWDSCSSLDKMIFGTEGITSANIFFDAFGFSWDADYLLGDNFDTEGYTEVTAYWGNPSAISASNGTNTFILFDDFTEEEINTSRWSWYDEEGSTVTIENNEAKIDQVCSNINFTLLSPLNLPRAAIDYKNRYSVGSAQQEFFRDDYTKTTAIRMAPDYSSMLGLKSGDEWISLTDDGTSQNNVTLIWDFSKENVTVGVRKNQTSYLPLAPIFGHSFQNIAFNVYAANGEQYLDSIRIRNYRFPEPIASSGYSLEIECPEIFPWCCIEGQKYESGVCCPIDKTCCLSSEDCGEHEVCDQRRGYNFCYVSKMNGVACTNSTNCASDHCNNFCCSAQSPLAQEMGNCEADGERCDYLETEDGLLCCQEDADCAVPGYFCHLENNAHQCLKCETEGNSICSSSACVGFDPDCCLSDGDCPVGEWCSEITCIPCERVLTFNCPSPACIGFDPDCCDANNPCPAGLIYDTSLSPPSCSAPVGDSCDSNADCRGESVCRANICVLSDFIFIESSNYLTTLGQTLNVPLNIVDPMHKSGIYVAAIEGSGRNFARFPGATEEYSFQLSGGDSHQIPINFMAGALGNYEVRIKVWNARTPEIVSIKSFNVMVQGGTTAPLMMSAPELSFSSLLFIFILAPFIFKLF